MPEPRKDRVETASARALFRLWLPTVFGASMLVVEIPVVAAGAAGAADGGEALAAIGGGMAILVVVNTPALAITPLDSLTEQSIRVPVCVGREVPRRPARRPRVGGVLDPLAARLDATGPVEVHTHRGDVVSTLEAIRGCTAVIGVRLHSCILAYSVGVPFVLVDYHSKCGDFLETIGAPHARADTTLDNLDAVAHALERALARTQGPPRVPAAVAVDRCLAALGATRVWHGLNDRKDNP